MPHRRRRLRLVVKQKNFCLPAYAVFQRPTMWPAEVVGTKKPNPFGLFDMHGNVDEWCLDWHRLSFHAESPMNDPVMFGDPQDANSGRVARGGGSLAVAWWTHSATRPWDFPATPANPKGFRIVITGDLKTVVPASTGWQGWPATSPPAATAPLSSEKAQSGLSR